MNETKGYKNINLSDLGTRQKITQIASRVALFVPRLLGKLATKLVINPITKLATGQTYEQVRNAAADIAMAVQEEKAQALDERIEEGHKNLEDWKEDTEYYVGNLAKYKSYESTIEDLEKKQTKLRTSPKKLLVAKHYLTAMKALRSKHRQERLKQKALKKLEKAYEEQMVGLKTQEAEIKALELALSEAKARYEAMKANVEKYELDNDAEEKVEAATEPTVVEASPQEQALFAQMANMAALGNVPTSDASVLEAYGLSSEGPQKTM